jgi:selenocysteine-specific elongation factor
LTLGMIGHVDHGKTALVRALTGMETDRLPEERRRGISIALGFAYLGVEGAEVDIIDMPGHERFVRTMIAGATGVDAVVVVVAANEGVMPQTREHVDIAGLLGVRQAVIAVTKADLADAAQSDKVGASAAALAKAAGLNVVAPPVAVSAVTSVGLDELRAALAALLARAEPPEDAGFAWLPVDRAFTVTGHGTVVTGTLRRGVLRAGDEIELVPEGRGLRMRGLQVHGGKVDEARPGQRVAVNLRAVEPGELPRGVALATPGLLEPSRWLSVSLRAVEGAPDLQTGMRLSLLFGAAEVEVRLRLLDRDVLQAGEKCVAQLRADNAVAAPARERLILRLPTPPLTVAGGAIVDPRAVRQRRRAPGPIARLQALADARPEAIVEREIEAAAEQGVGVASLARLAGIAPGRTIAAIRVLDPEPLLLAKEKFVVHRSAFEKTLACLPDAIAASPPELGRDALTALLPRISAPVLDAALARLAAEGVLRQSGGRIALVDVARDSAQATRRRLEAVRMAEVLRTAGLTPPEPWKLAPDPARRQLLDRLIREGIAVRAPDRMQQRELVFHREAVETAQRTLAPILAGGGLLVSEIGAALGISRKFSVPLLEHLDSIGFTTRIDDRRVLTRQPDGTSEPNVASGVAR